MKKLKKDGSIDGRHVSRIAEVLSREGKVLLPVDGIYGLAALSGPERMKDLCRLSGKGEHEIIRTVSSFKLIDEVAAIGKLEFDFLHRIWPGELVAYLRDHTISGGSVPVRLPKSKFINDIVSASGRPLLFVPLGSPKKTEEHHTVVFHKKGLLEEFTGRVELIVIIDEFCKEHALPSVVDISTGSLVIVNRGRISAEEIKSLYFLGKDDSAE